MKAIFSAHVNPSTIISMHWIVQVTKFHVAAVDLNHVIGMGNSMICSDIWHKYHERYFEILIRRC